MPRKETPWIIVHDGTCGDMAYALECERCGQVQKVAVPIQVSLWMAMAKAFGRMHRHCRERKEHPYYGH